MRVAGRAAGLALPEPTPPPPRPALRQVKLNTGIGIKSVTADGAEAECNGAPLTGQTFTVRMQGDEEWMVFTPPNTPLVCGSAGLSISDFTGTVRLALSDNCTTGKGAGPASQCGPGGVSQVRGVSFAGPLPSARAGRRGGECP